MMEEVNFKNHKKETLRGFVLVPKKYNTAIIFLHGFPAHCQEFGIKTLCKILSKLGNLVLRFDFAGTNMSEGSFEKKLLSQEAKDIKYAIDYISSNFEYKKLIIIGHSGGAINATLYAHKDKRIDKIVLLNGISNTKETVEINFSEQQKDNFRKKGFIIYNKPKKWYHKRKLKRSFYDECHKLEVCKAIKKYHKPLLIIQGTKDRLVSVLQAKKLFSVANDPKRLIIIKGADHNFSKIRYGIQVTYHIWKFIK